MMVFLFLIGFLLQDEVPFKSKETFEIKLNLSFRQPPTPDDERIIHLDPQKEAERKRKVGDPLPYLELKVKILTVTPEEVKVKVSKDGTLTVLNKKTSEGMEFKLDLGFTDDVKDGISGYKHVIEFISSEKKAVSKIVIEFDKEGNYFVNGEKRGRI